MKSFLRLMPSGCATASPLPSTIRNSLGLCTTPSGTAQDLTGHSPKASVTEPDYEREARKPCANILPHAPAAAREASSGNASGNRLAHSTTSTASPSDTRPSLSRKARTRPAAGKNQKWQAPAVRPGVHAPGKTWGWRRHPCPQPLHNPLSQMRFPRPQLSYHAQHLSRH